jgi:hypothetical protein
MWEIANNAAAVVTLLLFAWNLTTSIKAAINSGKKHLIKTLAYASIALVILVVGIADITIRIGWWNSPLQDIHDKHYSNEKVLLDGRAYSHCKFKNVTFVVNGKLGDLHDNQFEGTQYFTTDNEDIQHMLQQLNAFHIIHMDETGKISPPPSSCKGL